MGKPASGHQMPHEKKKKKTQQEAETQAVVGTTQHVKLGTTQDIREIVSDNCTEADKAQEDGCRSRA